MDLTEQAIGLWIKYRNMNEINTVNLGVLTKEFVKKHLKRETELENKVAELEQKLKASKTINNIINNDAENDLCKSLLTRIAMQMSISLEEYPHDDFSPYTIRDHTPTLSCYNVLISEQEYQYLRSLVEPIYSNMVNEFNKII